MRVIVSLATVLLAVEAIAAPAPFPRREKPLPGDAVVIDFSTLEAPAPANAQWYVGFDVFDTSGDHHACLYRWTGTAGKGAANRMVEQWSRVLKQSPGSQWLTVRVDASGQKLILSAKPPNRIKSIEVRLQGLAEAQRPTVRRLAR